MQCKRAGCRTLACTRHEPVPPSPCGACLEKKFEVPVGIAPLPFCAIEPVVPCSDCAEIAIHFAKLGKQMVDRNGCPRCWFSSKDGAAYCSGLPVGLAGRCFETADDSALVAWFLLVLPLVSTSFALAFH